MVTNAELFKLITDFKDEMKLKCEGIKKANEEGIKILADDINGRLDRLDQRLDTIDETHLAHAKKLEEIDERIEEVDAKTTEGLTSAINRISKLETQIQHLEIELPNQIRQLCLENDYLREELENRTNRQLRRTLIFKNIPETKDDESYAEVKALLAKIISTHTEITNAEALAGIERAHRESKKRDGVREGRRKIFVAFLNWELPQLILNEFRKKRINDPTFDIYAEQMYGPMTSQRRNLAFQARKKLKEEGSIVSGYVAFPARLMVNLPGEVDRMGKKYYKLHENFSDHEVERR